ncbi:cyclin-A3-1-like isoform X2 [Quercus robur]|uniref:cyclin-A3-1-like isoform X2 n=1 Tax=Quercus robur TaxID=38942 RepID=UPI0021614CE5|nr:cyclin-A3-1-like isoform X2 [Quercus robur]
MRSTKKRASSATSSLQLQFPTPKKRVVLSDLTNSPDDVGSTRNSEDFAPNKPKCENNGAYPNCELDEPTKSETVISSTCMDHFNCTYSNSIHSHLRAQEMEVHRRPFPDYMETVQNEVSTFMREILVNWLVEVAEEYKLVSDTIYLTISYIDRFLSSNVVSKSKIQLLGVSCMLNASQYEEISPPNVEDFCYITDNSYTKEEVMDMEREVQKFLNFEMGVPTIKNFLRIYTRAAQENCNSLALQCYSGYRPFDLMECVLTLHDLQINRKGSSLQAVREKYMQHKYKCVASLTSPSEIPACYFEVING